MKWLTRLSPAQLIALTYLIGVLVGAAVLTLPAMHSGAVLITPMNALFTATSALCITGLVVVDTGQAWSVPGQLFLLLLMQIGGIGIITFGTVRAFLTGGRVNVSQRLSLMQQVQASDLANVVPLIRSIFVYAFVLQGLGTLLLWPRLAQEDGTWPGLYSAYFHAVSAYNNAGFVLYDGGMTRFVGDPLVNLVISGLVIAGGIGFLVQLNVVMHLFTRRRTRLLLHTRIALGMAALLLGLGMLAVAVLEWRNANTLGELPLHARLLGAFFQSMTARSGGFATVDIAALNPATLLVMIVLMYIGASPGSTGGGLKTTTLFVILAGTWNMMRGRAELVAFRRTIAPGLVLRAVTIAFLLLSVILLMFFLLLVTNPHIGFTPLLFEVVSAAATVGLSMGATGQLNDMGQLLVVVMMYLGRIGSLTFIFAFNPRRVGRVRYPREDGILVG